MRRLVGFFFFFSSRRRHTRFDCDWSSDVCSSDLEILGDPHNLFGDTSAVHVDVAEDGTYDIRHLVEGDRVSEVLSYVEYSKRDLMERVRRAAEGALKNGRITFEESGRLLKRYEEGMESYTYLARG